MSVSSSELRRIVFTVWSTQLGIELGGPAAGEPGSAVGPRRLTVRVEIVGDFDGELVQSCSDALGRRAAAVAFGGGHVEIGPDQVHDTLGELAHMTAGNLKSMLPGSNRVHLPQSNALPCQSTKILAEARFEVDGETLAVTLSGRRGAR